MDKNSTGSKRFSLYSALAYLFPIVLFVFYALIKVSNGTRDGEFNLVSIEILNPLIYSIANWGTFSTWLMLLLASILSCWKRSLPRPGLGLLICLLFCPFCVICHSMNNLGPWTTYGRVLSEDGNEYVFCDSSLLQGQLMAIGEVTQQGIFKTKFKVLVSNNGDSPRSWASVIRPDSPNDSYGQLYLKNGFLLGIRYDNKCYLAFDLENQTAIGHGAIETISPFVSLSANDVPSAADIERVCHRIRNHANLCSSDGDKRHAEDFLNGETVRGCPPIATLREVQEGGIFDSMAKEILKCYSDVFEELRNSLGGGKRD